MYLSSQLTFSVSSTRKSRADLEEERKCSRRTRERKKETHALDIIVKALIRSLSTK
jgi:hypothetical protein